MTYMEMAEMTIYKASQCCSFWEHKVPPQCPVCIGAVMQDFHTELFHRCGEFSSPLISATGFELMVNELSSYRRESFQTTRHFRHFSLFS